MIQLGKIIGDAVGKAGGNIIEQTLGSITKTVDEFHLSKEEKAEIQNKITEGLNKHQEAILEAANRELELHNAEMDSARKRDIEANNSQHSSWLARNIAALLAITITVGCFIMWYIVLFKDIPKEKEVLVSGILGSLTTIDMGVIGYYFGSSHSSSKKQEAINEILKK